MKSYSLERTFFPCSIISLFCLLLSLSSGGACKKKMKSRSNPEVEAPDFPEEEGEESTDPNLLREKAGIISASPIGFTGPSQFEEQKGPLVGYDALEVDVRTRISKHLEDVRLLLHNQLLAISVELEKQKILAEGDLYTSEEYDSESLKSNIDKLHKAIASHFSVVGNERHSSGVPGRYLDQEMRRSDAAKKDLDELEKEDSKYWWFPCRRWSHGTKKDQLKEEMIAHALPVLDELDTFKIIIKKIMAAEELGRTGSLEEIKNNIDAIYSQLLNSSTRTALDYKPFQEAFKNDIEDLRDQEFGTKLTFEHEQSKGFTEVHKLFFPANDPGPITPSKLQRFRSCIFLLDKETAVEFMADTRFNKNSNYYHRFMHALKSTAFLDMSFKDEIAGYLNQYLLENQDHILRNMMSSEIWELAVIAIKTNFHKHDPSDKDYELNLKGLSYEMISSLRGQYEYYKEIVQIKFREDVSKMLNEKYAALKRYSKTIITPFFEEQRLPSAVNRGTTPTLDYFLFYLYLCDKEINSSNKTYNVLVKSSRNKNEQLEKMHGLLLRFLNAAAKNTRIKTVHYEVLAGEYGKNYLKGFPEELKRFNEKVITKYIKLLKNS